MTRITEPASSTRRHLRAKAALEARMKSEVRPLSRKQRAKARLYAAVMPITPNQVVQFEIENQRTCFPAVESALSVEGEGR